MGISVDVRLANFVSTRNYHIRVLFSKLNDDRKSFRLNNSYVELKNIAGSHFAYV